MATKTTMVSTGFSDTTDRSIDRDEGPVYVRRPDEDGGGYYPEPRSGYSHSSTKGQQTKLGERHDVYNVVPATRDPVCNGENTEGVVYKVGDINSTAKGSGARANWNKTRLDLIPLHLLDNCADVFEYGINKYAEWNWAKGMAWNIPYQCLLRHLSAWYRGEDNDPESGKSHLGHAMANLIMLEHYSQSYKEGDNRPKSYFEKEKE